MAETTVGGLISHILYYQSRSVKLSIVCFLQILGKMHKSCDTLLVFIQVKSFYVSICKHIGMRVTSQVFTCSLNVQRAYCQCVFSNFIWLCRFLFVFIRFQLGHQRSLV
jgi:hypothetical protein